MSLVHGPRYLSSVESVFYGCFTNPGERAIWSFRLKAEVHLDKRKKGLFLGRTTVGGRREARIIESS